MDLPFTRHVNVGDVHLVHDRPPSHRFLPSSGAAAALEKAREAKDKERALVKYRQANNLADGISAELSYAVDFNLALMYQNSRRALASEFVVLSELRDGLNLALMYQNSRYAPCIDSSYYPSHMMAST